MSGWIDEAKRTDFSDVMGHLGINHVRKRSIGPCPGCGADRRGSTDSRGPIDLRDRDGTVLWRCRRCEAGGDLLDLVAHVLENGKFSGLDREGHKRVWRWFADRRFCEAPREYTRAASPPAPKVKVCALEVRGVAPHGDPAELQRLWDACSRFDGSPTPDCGPIEYLKGRGFCVSEVFATDVCRATPMPGTGFSWPAFWYGETWVNRSGERCDGYAPFRLLFQAFDANGVFRAVHGRRILKYDYGLVPVCEACGGDLPRLNWSGPRHLRRVVERCDCGWKAAPKTLWAKGILCERLLFADRGGQAALRGDDDAPLKILVVEGVTDLLRAAIVAARTEGVGVVGFTSGGAEALGDVCWRAGTVLAVATDNDKAGNAYADKVAEAILPRRARRVIWAELSKR